MKELDFDELDKAVNSLMGDLPKTDGPAADSPSLTETTSDSVESSNEGSQSTSPTDNASIEEVTSPALPSPASRRGGRFMDVVHPSSDMKTTRMGATSREGVSISPPASEMPSSPSLEQSAPDDKVVLAEETAETPAPSEWPDPIALHEEKQGEENEAPDLDTSLPTPLSSPFLTDAKVEKRPLGGGQALDQAIANELGKVDTEQPTLETSEAADQPDSSPVVDAPAETPAPEPSPPLIPAPEEKAPLPAELASDLVAIEAGGTTAPESQSAPAAIVPTEAPSAPVIGGGSIQQQYTEQPNTGDESHAAIYDTEAAGQPLLHPPKKKTGWLVIIWIVLIIILGIGVGATIWYFGLI